MFMGRKREFISAAAPTADPTLPPSITTDSAANCAEPANTIADMTIACSGEKPASVASTPNETDSTKPAIAYGIAALKPVSNCSRGVASRSSTERDPKGALPCARLGGRLHLLLAA